LRCSFRPDTCDLGKFADNLSHRINPLRHT
jgi:hypothetical protein